MNELHKTLVFTDLHGDLNAMANSFASFGIMKYNKNNFSDLVIDIKKYAETADNSGIKKFIIKQQKPTHLILLGDYVDRNNYSYHIIEFLQALEWKDYNIKATFLLGNHDLLNLIFFINPFKFHTLYKFTGIGLKHVTDFLDSIQLIKSYNSFIELHKNEILELQSKFFKNKEIELPLENYSIKLKYNYNHKKISKLVCNMHKQNDFFDKLTKITGVKRTQKIPYFGYSQEMFFNILYWYINTYFVKFENQNYFQLQTQFNNEFADYGNLGTANYLTKQVDENILEIQIVDWRIISYVWRKHYGNFFRNIKYWYLENSILYTHAGLSPQVIVDSFTFAPIFDLTTGKIDNKLGISTNKNISGLIKRSNKMVEQLIHNSLLDYSFEKLSGLEIIDIIGYSRSFTHGIPKFGGILWSDFNYIQKFILEQSQQRKLNSQMLTYYADFHKLTKINKIICGHSQHVDKNESDIRYRKMKGLEKTGLEYICIDNGCSESYRAKNGSIINGIEIDKNGKIITTMY